MNPIAAAIRAVEATPLPDAVTRAGVEFLVGTRRRSLASAQDNDAAFARAMADHPIAEHADTANEQHYELPPRFFELTLGPRRKYSCCLYPTGHETLAEAEILALEETIAHAGLADGQTILELGCGWGSLTLFMAARFPRSRIVAVSNSAPQRRHIEALAEAAGLTNLLVVTADMNDFQSTGTFDRIVSVEMFEHMSNWKALLDRARGWLNPVGRMFLHVFSHRSQPYRFDKADQTDWIAQHFFTGGIMPSHGLIGHFPECFEIEEQWRWNGGHYQRTAEQWLARFDANRTEVDAVLREVYGDQAKLWRRRWRLFYLATAGLFGHAGGEEWGVSHYRLRPVADPA
ncbi:class I SAM-dependent methyltransferase [Sphingomonas sp. CGMCC 1.13654]|uniref:Class I SAM-dependent methyltransferase n=1 Tax=Sphingomonas chungangi TaxID=2683589 RepID=A0A838L0L1_9SPHN|nr:cyclopropane-fatty-acyl-phospholipid synthase family protein [Sphingomonas chungangi]MBA2932881.1 class I SAM-dependent methyltransferase [Sphingomonas chungangi]MVW56501.1 methyltransferase domain-containing protein [Sphingomonas chungangi]